MNSAIRDKNWACLIRAVAHTITGFWSPNTRKSFRIVYGNSVKWLRALARHSSVNQAAGPLEAGLRITVIRFTCKPSPTSPGGHRFVRTCSDVFTLSRRRRFWLTWVSCRSRFLSVRKFSFHLAPCALSFREKTGRFRRNLSTQRVRNTLGAARFTWAVPSISLFRIEIAFLRNDFSQTEIQKRETPLKTFAQVDWAGLVVSLTNSLFSYDPNCLGFERKLSGRKDVALIRC